MVDLPMSFIFNSPDKQTFGTFLKAHPDVEHALKNLMMDRMFDIAQYKKLIDTKTNPFHINTNASLRIADVKFYQVSTSFGAMVYARKSVDNEYTLVTNNHNNVLVMVNDLCYVLLQKENRFVYVRQAEDIMASNKHNVDLVARNNVTGQIIPHTAYAWIFFT